MKKFVLAAVAGWALSMGAQAATEVPSVLKVPLSQGLTIHRSFEGPSGLTGWVLIKKDNESLVVFTTADGKTLMSGAVINERGQNLIEGYVEAYAPKADFSSFATDLGKATAIVQGDQKGKTVIYAFFDPTCPYCNVAYTTIKGALKPGVQVRWIPVAFLSQKSSGQAAALLRSPDMTAAMEQHEALFKSGGIASAEMTADVKRVLDDNLELFRKMGFKGVPAILYRAADGRLDATKGAPTPAEVVKLMSASR